MGPRRCTTAPANPTLRTWPRGEALKRRHGLSKIEFQVELDPGLLGGFVLQLQGITYDKSVRGMLQGLRRSLKEGK